MADRASLSGESRTSRPTTARQDKAMFVNPQRHQMRAGASQLQLRRGQGRPARKIANTAAIRRLATVIIRRAQVWSTQPVTVTAAAREQTMTIHEYLMQACQDDARRAGERDRLLLEARRASLARRGRAGPIAPVKRLAALILHRATG
jgi:hypothetical protein